MHQSGRCSVFLAIALTCAASLAQTTPKGVAKTVVNASSFTGTTSIPATSSGSSQTFHDPAYKVSFDYPSDWTFARRDGEISTFHLDARSAPSSSRLRAVAAIPENPFPSSTFSGAYVYLSVTPHANDASCANQATAHSGRSSAREVAGVAFVHGHDEQRNICITARDEVYTTYRRGACYRFDLAINNFCGGQVSGVKDITQKELDDVRSRMEAILATVRFDHK